MNRPAICTKDRTESMMMGIFQTNSITIRCILGSGFDHSGMVNIGMGMIVKSLKLWNICAEPQYFRQGAWQAEGEGTWSRGLPKSVKVNNFMLMRDCRPDKSSICGDDYDYDYDFDYDDYDVKRDHILSRLSKPGWTTLVPPMLLVASTRQRTWLRWISFILWLLLWFVQWWI